MQHELRFTGVSHAPSDYDCPEGSLALSIDVINEDGSLRAILPPKHIASASGEGLQVIYIHKTSAYENYIVDGGDNALWWGTLQGIQDAGATNRHNITELRQFQNIKQIQHIGNTLVVLDEEGMHYLLYQDGAYRYLGGQVPEVSLAFGLQGDHPYAVQEGDTPLRTSTGISYGTYLREYYASVSTVDWNILKTDIPTEVMPKINKMLAERARDKNLFVFPFFVRYAIRLYDGSLIRHSAPILMIPNSGSPALLFNKVGREVLPIAFVAQLCYTALQAESVEHWTDIVRSVDVFVSAPIYTYDQNYKPPTEYESVQTLAPIEVTAASGYGYGWHKRSTTTEPQEQERHQYISMSEVMQSTGFNDIESYFPSPALPDDKIEEAIRSAGQFYLIASIPLEELTKQGEATSGELRPLKIKKGTLAVLQTGEAMTDDYHTHDRLMPSLAFVYNARLNLSEIRQDPYSGYLPQAATAYLTERTATRAFVYIKQDGRDIVVERVGELDLASTYYYYYPNPRAYKVVFVQGNSIIEHQVKRHDFLNGAYVFNGLHKPLSEGSTADEAPTASPLEYRLYAVANKIFTSEVNNPFLFPARGINTIGTGRILGLSTATKALSQGQYGQFPLYAFTTEGVWALEVGANGTFSSKHPTSRDVCINPQSITQTDTAVLFTTERGIMMLSGSEVKPISDALLGDLFKMEASQAGRDLLELSGYHDVLLNNLEFEAMLPHCRMLYDYTNARIIVYTPQVRGDTTRRLAYVYSLRSASWAMTTTALQYGIASYPEALAVTTQGRLVNYAHRPQGYEKQEQVKGLVVTRPLSITGRSELKTLRRLVLRGVFPDYAVSTALFGTMDYIHWELIGSSRDYYLTGFSGSPYRAFRLVMLTSLNGRESISSVSIDYVPKLNARMR